MDPKVEVVPIEDFTEDPKNANRGSPRGTGMLENSLQELGAGRSILVDKNRIVLAGNKTWSVARERGFTEVVVVKTKGQQLVAVQREDLEINEPRAKKLALADNRVAEVNLSWDPEILKEMQADVKLDGLWTDEELKKILDTQEVEPTNFNRGNDGARNTITCPNCGEQFKP